LILSLKEYTLHAFSFLGLCLYEKRVSGETNRKSKDQMMHFLFLREFISRETITKWKEKKKWGGAYSKITKGGQRVSNESMETYVTSGECTVSPILSQSLQLL
jgi:hypothetical protein